MKVLSIRQPWAWAIIYGGKDVENRTWSTNYRGPLLIHAGKARPAERDMQGFVDLVHRGHLLRHLEGPLTTHQLCEDICEYGGIIGQVRLWGCKTSSKSGWGVGPYHWLLSDPEPLDFTPCNGRLGLFNMELP